jgi:hypothetical protein
MKGQHLELVSRLERHASVAFTLVKDCLAVPNLIDDYVVEAALR